MSYAIVRTDNMAGTVVPSKLVSAKYMVGDETPTAIENGNVVKLVKLMAGQREIYSADTPKATTPIDEVVLVAGVEVPYDERKKNLEDYINEAGVPFRGYKFEPGDIFSVTYEAIDLLSSDPVVGHVVELQAGTKLKEAASATSNTVIGVIENIETVNGKKYCVIKVEPVTAA